MEKLLEVNQHEKVDSAWNLYERCYMKRYGGKPVVANFAFSRTILDDLVRKLGFQKTEKLLQRYFASDGDNNWYTRNGHSLPVLQKNIEALSSQVSLQEKRDTGLDPVMSIRTWCGNVQCKSTWLMPMKFSEIQSKHGRSLCDRCAAEEF